MGKSSSGLLWGGLLVGVGILWLLNNTGAFEFDFGEMVSRGWPIIIIALGVWMLAGRNGKNKVNLSTNVSGVVSDKMSHGVGEVELAPEAIDSRGLEIRMGAGEVKLDLRGTRLEQAENRVTVKVGLGDVRIDLPKDLPVSVDAKTGGGDLHLLGRESDGFAAKLEFKDPGYDGAPRRLLMTVRVGLGDVRVRRA